MVQFILPHSVYVSRHELAESVLPTTAQRSPIHGTNHSVS